MAHEEKKEKKGWTDAELVAEWSLIFNCRTCGKGFTFGAEDIMLTNKENPEANCFVDCTFCKRYSLMNIEKLPTLISTYVKNKYRNLTFNGQPVEVMINKKRMTLNSDTKLKKKTWKPSGIWDDEYYVDGVRVKYSFFKNLRYQVVVEKKRVPFMVQLMLFIMP